MDTENINANLIELTTDIVASYVAHNSIAPQDLSELIHATYAALASIENGTAATEPEEPLVPAVSIKKSVTPDYIVCLEDGMHFKSLKRHLRILIWPKPWVWVTRARHQAARRSPNSSLQTHYLWLCVSVA